jgi:hypothetical protein
MTTQIKPLTQDELAVAYWLIDEITIGQMIPEVRAHEFQVWKLTVNQAAAKGRLTCEDGNGNVIHTHKIPFTDFPMGAITIWAEFDGEHRVTMLPRER